MMQEHGDGDGHQAKKMTWSHAVRGLPTLEIMMLSSGGDLVKHHLGVHFWGQAR
jgi:hypothetical protein